MEKGTPLADIRDIVAALQEQPQPAAPAMGSLMTPADQAAMQPETFANPAVQHVLGSLATLPQRAIENSQQSLDTGTYDPGPTLEAAMLPMGTGAIAGVPVRAGEAVLGAGPIRAFHGSPHDFDAFSMDKIGTGEGAQAYGHGLYFADNEGVAKSYRDALSKQVSVDGQQLGLVSHPSDSPLATAQHAVAGHVANGLYPEEAIAQEANAWREAAKRYESYAKEIPEAADQAQKFHDVADQIGALDPNTFKKNPGHMYEVNINADPDHFLDWDKPLPADTLAKVQSAAQNIKPNLYERMMGEGRDLAKWSLQPENVRPDMTGQQALGSLKRGLGSDAAASQALRDAGIPGIKYLDAGSRATGDGSRNYVLFDDKLVNIARKYGMGSLAALPPAVIAAGQGGPEDPAH